MNEQVELIGKLTEALREAREERDQLRTVVERLRRSYEGELKVGDGFSIEVGRLRAELADLRIELSQARAELPSLYSDRDQLRAEVERLRESQRRYEQLDESQQRVIADLRAEVTETVDVQRELEFADLRAQLAEAQQKGEDWFRDWEQAAEKAKSYAAQLVAAQEDSKRLDWMSATAVQIVMRKDWGIEPTREAIDTARKEAQP